MPLDKNEMTQDEREIVLVETVFNLSSTKRIISNAMYYLEYSPRYNKEDKLIRELETLAKEIESKALEIEEKYKSLYRNHNNERK